jgi:hypothetical protein
MAKFNVRVPDELAARFDAWAGAHGGRSPALRHLIDTASREGLAAARRLERRPEKLTVRLSAEDAGGLDREARAMGLTRNAWVAALVRHRLSGRPTFSRTDEVSLLAIQAELRRVGVNVNQIARALNTAVLEDGRVLELEIAYLDDLRREMRAHVQALGEAFAGNLSYWRAEP